MKVTISEFLRASDVVDNEIDKVYKAAWFKDEKQCLYYIKSASIKIKEFISWIDQIDEMSFGGEDD